MFPDSKEYTEFLLRRIKEMAVSYEFVQAFCQALYTAIPGHEAVSAETVKRLDVDYCDTRIRYINRAFPTRYNEETSHHTANGHRLVFLMVLKMLIHDLKNGEAAFLPRPKIVLTDETEEQYSWFFFVALAMLAGTEADPSLVPYEEAKPKPTKPPPKGGGLGLVK